VVGHLWHVVPHYALVGVNCIPNHSLLAKLQLESPLKNVVVISDPHSGSVVGITPPRFQGGETRPDQIALWEAATGMVARFKKKYGEVDILIVNGDCLEGKCSKWGATDVITTRIRTQIDMAAEFILGIGATDIVMTRGTPYHVGAEEDWEDFLARDVGATAIKDHAFLEIEGINFSVKHKISSSTIPHGRHTAVARSRIWDVLWAEKGQHPKSDIIIRSHVHYFDYCGNHQWLGLTTPALQGLGSKFGARMCEGTVDFGMVYFFCDKGNYEWGWDIVEVEEQREEVIQL